MRFRDSKISPTQTENHTSRPNSLGPIHRKSENCIADLQNRIISMYLFIEPTNQIRIAFFTEDAASPSIVEAGIDNFQLEIIICGDDCLGDLNSDGEVSVSDLLSIIAAWGTDDENADVDGNGIVAVGDLLIAIGNWGNCE